MPRLITVQAQTTRLFKTAGSIRDGNAHDHDDNDDGGGGGGGGGGDDDNDDNDDDDDDDDADDFDSCNFSDAEMSHTGEHRSRERRSTGDSDASDGSSLTQTSYTPQFSIQATMYFGIIDFLQVRQCARCRVRAALTRCCARACRSGT